MACLSLRHRCAVMRPQGLCHCRSFPQVCRSPHLPRRVHIRECRFASIGEMSPTPTSPTSQQPPSPFGCWPRHWRMRPRQSAHSHRCLRRRGDSGGCALHSWRSRACSFCHSSLIGTPPLAAGKHRHRGASPCNTDAIAMLIACLGSSWRRARGWCDSGHMSRRSLAPAIAASLLARSHRRFHAWCNGDRLDRLSVHRHPAPAVAHAGRTARQQRRRGRLQM